MPCRLPSTSIHANGTPQGRRRLRAREVLHHGFAFGTPTLFGDVSWVLDWRVSFRKLRLDGCMCGLLLSEQQNTVFADQPPFVMKVLCQIEQSVWRPAIEQAKCSEYMCCASCNTKKTRPRRPVDCCQGPLYRLGDSCQGPG